MKTGYLHKTPPNKPVSMMYTVAVLQYHTVPHAWSTILYMPHCTTCYSMLPHCTTFTTWSTILYMPHCTTCYSMLPHCTTFTTWSCTCSTTLYHTVPHGVALTHQIHYHTLPHPYGTILYSHALPWHTVPRAVPHVSHVVLYKATEAIKRPAMSPPWIANSLL